MITCIGDAAPAAVWQDGNGRAGRGGTGDRTELPGERRPRSDPLPSDSDGPAHEILMPV